jgi:hypothetical protein
MDRFVITADDRTGALEVAGALADRLGRTVRVTTTDVDDAVERLVVDLGSRHLAAGRQTVRVTEQVITSPLRSSAPSPPGLPIIRTSVDHGTAFDIAWQGVAFTESLEHALAAAWRLAGRR